MRRTLKNQEKKQTDTVSNLNVNARLLAYCAMAMRDACRTPSDS